MLLYAIAKLVCVVAHQDGELVTFSEVVGMEQLNHHKPIKVKNCKVRDATCTVCREHGSSSWPGLCCTLSVWPATSAVFKHLTDTELVTSHSCFPVPSYTALHSLLALCASLSAAPLL